MFDLACLDTQTGAEQGRPFRPLNPRTLRPIELEPATASTPPKLLEIVLLGRRSGIAQEKLEHIQKMNEARPLGAPPLTPDEVRAQNAEFLSVLTVSWNFDELDAAPLPCTPSNARKVFGDPRFAHMAEGALAFIRDDGNFLAAPISGPSTGLNAPSP